MNDRRKPNRLRRKRIPESGAPRSPPLLLTADVTADTAPVRPVSTPLHSAPEILLWTVTVEIDLPYCNSDSLGMASENPPAETRTRHVAFYLTPFDGDELKRFAADLEFKSVSQMVSAIVERLIIGGFSPLCWLKVGLQFSARARKFKTNTDAGFYFGVRPLPPLPDEPISLNEWKPVIEEIEREIGKTTNNAKTQMKQL